MFDFIQDNWLFFLIVGVIVVIFAVGITHESNMFDQCMQDHRKEYECWSMIRGGYHRR